MNPDPGPIEDAMLPTTEAIRRTMVAVVVIGAVLVLGAGVWMGLRVAGSVAVGVGAATLNLFLLERVVVGLIEGKGGAAGGVGLFKLLILFGGSWGLFRAGLAEAMPFAAGFAALPLGVTLSPMFLQAPRAQTPASPSSPGARGA
ncbi:MAG: hypothetical protein MUF64_29430 [Polyangiaceae bacterium]|jgi:asparagine N-glycosylation enzyme membrane subunit Stt3|nr:hypothetical protein [Polyangiaceae bacterium]